MATTSGLREDPALHPDTILEASRRLAPHSELTLSLAEDLLAARRPYGDVLLWPEKVEPMLISPDPSIAHTARAVRALAQVQAVRPTTQIQDALDQAAAWLVGRDLGNVSEIIDRPLEAGIETLYTRHFTAAWVVKALVSVGLPASHPAGERRGGLDLEQLQRYRCPVELEQRRLAHLDDLRRP